ncbi:hypothetical protein EK21DRAFT_29268, partial [Setomelanomma holmii]
TFFVHKDVLNKSLFFNNALKPEWESMREGKPIDVADHAPATFEAYLKWLYSHVVPTASDLSYVRMYVLGEQLADLEFQDAVISILIDHCIQMKSYPVHVDGTELIYSGTAPISPARRLLVDFCCYAGSPKWL